MEESKSNRKRLYVYTVAFAAFALVVALIVVMAVIKIRSTVANDPPMIDLFYKKAKRFTPEEKAAVIERHAGYWAFAQDTLIAGSPLHISDRLEIKDNGILWQVTQWRLIMPSGTERTFSGVRTALLTPYGALPPDTLNDVEILLQAFACEADTVFGFGFFGEMWDSRISAENLLMSKRLYHPYRGDIADFFPGSLIDLLSDVESQFYRVENNGKMTVNKDIYRVRRVEEETGEIRYLPLADSMNGLTDFFKQRLVEEYDRLGLRSTDAAALEDLFNRYYQPILLSQRWRAMPQVDSRTVQVSFAVNPDGGVDEVRVPSSLGRRVATELRRDISTWRFPPADSTIPLSVEVVLP